MPQGRPALREDSGFFVIILAEASRQLLSRLRLHCVPSTTGLLWLGAFPKKVGEWLSLVEHLVRDQGVGGSNPLSPTNTFKYLNFISGIRVGLVRQFRDKELIHKRPWRGNLLAGQFEVAPKTRLH